jgi:DNA (cytosine-5)-methyltransferase 1
LELKSPFRKIYRQNFPQTVELGSDIQKIGDEKILEWKKDFGEIDVVIGGPPCQGFSLSGKRNTKDPRNNLFKSYLKVVRGLQPKVAVMENVRLLTSMKTADGESVLKSIYEEFENSDYCVKHFEINAKDYGVPQHRERVIFIAVRKDLKTVEPSMPSPTHGIMQSLFSPVAPYRTFADACSDLEFLESGEKSATDSLHEAVKHPDHVIEWLWDVPQGKSAHDNEDPILRPPSGYNTTYKRQIWDKPASTVQTTFGMISGCRNVHPISTRSLTVREAARIQSFPDTFNFVGSLGDIRATIGNAVPPLLAYAIANHIKTELLNLVEVSSL